MDELQLLLQVMDSIGTIGLLLYLFVTERKNHQETTERWINDLRSISGLSRRTQVQRQVESID